MKKTSVARRVKELGLVAEFVDFMESLGWDRLKLVVTVFHADSYRSFDLDVFSAKGREDQIQRQHLPEPLCQKIDQVMDEFKSVEKLVLIVEKSGDIEIRSYSKGDLRKLRSEQWQMEKRETPPTKLERIASLSREAFGESLARKVAIKLERGASLGHLHRDYCGIGLCLKGDNYCYVEIYDGYPIDPPLESFPSQKSFIHWLCKQSDYSLARLERGAFYEMNQTITKERLERFTG